MSRSISIWLATALALASLGCQPSETRPGLWLNGESVEAPVADWSFTDAFQNVFIQTSPWYGLPHSVTIWCAAQDGELYIGYLCLNPGVNLAKKPDHGFIIRRVIERAGEYQSI